MSLRVVVPQHQAAGGGIGTYVRGLTAALQTVPDVEVVPVAPRARRQGPLGRLLLEQTAIPRAVGPGDLLHMTDLRVPFAAPRDRTVVTLHDIGFLTRPEHHGAAVRRYKTLQLDAMLRWGPAAIACVSAHTRDELLEHRPRASRVRVVPPGVPAPAVRTAAPRAPTHLLTVGAYDARKNLGMLLEAFRLARSRGLALDWISVGPTDAAPPGLVDALRAEPGVTLAGFVPQERLEELWAGAAVLAMPSVLEGFSFPVVEAMQRGVPVVAARGSALDETVADHGLRVAAGDVAGWADALLRLEHDAEFRAGLVAGAHEHVAAMSWPLRIGAFVDLYREIAGR